MLQSINGLYGFAVHARDGGIGTVEDLYFDDVCWTTRYLLVNSDQKPVERRVLIAPAAAGQVDWAAGVLPVNLTCEQVRHSPDMSADKPVSRQNEEQLSAYYAWPAYWSLDPFGGEAVPLPILLPPAEMPAGKGDPHLRSAKEVKGYHLRGRDGSIGHLVDFAVDDADWKIEFMVVDAGSWLHQRLVLVKPAWVESIHWEDRQVVVGLTRDAIRSSPPFTSHFPISPEYAEQLVKHYRRDG